MLIDQTHYQADIYGAAMVGRCVILSPMVDITHYMYVCICNIKRCRALLKGQSKQSSGRPLAYFSLHIWLV